MEKCPICLEDIIQHKNSLYTSCCHNFHTTCYINYVIHNNTQKCPMCRKNEVNIRIQKSPEQKICEYENYQMTAERIREENRRRTLNPQLKYIFGYN